jgi:peroxiredoxin
MIPVYLISVALGVNSMSLHVGDKAPDFTLPSHLDKEITLSDLRGKNVVLAFFPMAWTPV